MLFSSITHRDNSAARKVRTSVTAGTLAINVTGTFLLGLITALTLNHIPAEQLHIILGGGLMGGFTTSGTMSFETVRLTQDHHHGAALANGVGTLVLVCAAIGLGLWIGLLL